MNRAMTRREEARDVLIVEIAKTLEVLGELCVVSLGDLGVRMAVVNRIGALRETRDLFEGELKR